MLQAILGVENALTDYRVVSASVPATERVVRLNRGTTELTRETLRPGAATLSDLIDTRQALAVAEQMHADTLRRLGASLITLSARLWGGCASQS